MANEITISVSGTLNNAPVSQTPLRRSFNPGAVSITQSSRKRAGHTQLLTTSWEALDLEDVTDGYVFLSNLDSTNNVEFGPLEAGSGGDGVKLGTLEPGDPPAHFHVTSGVTIMARAATSTASVDVECWSS